MDVVMDGFVGARRDMAVSAGLVLVPTLVIVSAIEGGLLLGAGANYWAQWMTYSRSAPETLSRLSIPLLLVQCLSDETLPGDTLARNVAILRGVTSTNKNAQLRELRDHDHLGLRPGDRQPSPELIRIVVDWLNHHSRDGQRDAPADAASPPRR